MADIFLFDGGWYKRGEDDGRIRVPLKQGRESQTIMYDPELQADAQSSIGGELPMKKYADIFDGLAIGDSIYIHLVPDAMGVRGWWAAPQDAVAGFKVDMDVVSVESVYKAIQAGNLGATVAGLVPKQEIDFTNGLGDAPLDAEYRAHQNEGKYVDYRNPAAHVGGYYDTPVLLTVGNAGYIRLTVTALADTVVEDGCEQTCSSCGSAKGWPRFQYGLIVDRTCFSKQEARTYCACDDPICAGCDSTDIEYE